MAAPAAPTAPPAHHPSRAGPAAAVWRPALAAPGGRHWALVSWGRPRAVTRGSIGISNGFFHWPRAPTPYPDPGPCSLATLPLLLRSARMPSATCPAGALAGGPRLPAPPGATPQPRQCAAVRRPGARGSTVMIGETVLTLPSPWVHLSQGPTGMWCFIPQSTTGGKPGAYIDIQGHTRAVPPETPTRENTRRAFFGTLCPPYPSDGESGQRAERHNRYNRPRRLNQSAFAFPSSFALPHGQTVPEVRGLRLSSSARRAERG